MTQVYPTAAKLWNPCVLLIQGLFLQSLDIREILTAHSSDTFFHWESSISQIGFSSTNTAVPPCTILVVRSRRNVFLHLPFRNLKELWDGLGTNVAIATLNGQDNIKSLISNGIFPVAKIYAYCCLW